MSAETIEYAIVRLLKKRPFYGSFVPGIFMINKVNVKMEISIYLP